MAERMFGQETEYALAVLDRQGRTMAPEEAVMSLMAAARQSYTHLPEPASNGIFLSNGARFYIDCGMHPELTTPEVTNPWDAVRYTAAGDLVLKGAAARLADENKEISEVVILKTNVDYLTHNTWGCHESYLHGGDHAEVGKQVLPHLVSRLIYTGAGGFDPRHPGLAFRLSPRVSHLTSERSDQSTHSRGIWHTKDESLSSRGYHRAHILCGESLCGHIPQFLKMGTTALVVAMAEADVRPAEGYYLTSPVEAIRRFAADPECKAAVDTVSGGRPTALDIQRHYLALAETHARAPFMPPWTGDVCKVWKETLDALERDPESLSDTLDWRIKLSLFQDYANRQGFDWGSLRLWSEALVQLNQALSGTDYAEGVVTVEFIQSKDSPIRDHVKIVRQSLEERGIVWDNLEAFVRLRQRLFEIDLRFGQVGEKGIFLNLDASGRLHHRMVSPTEIERATYEPPASGRARVRGGCIQRLAGRGGAAIPRCSWTSILDMKKGQMLDLSDPWQDKEVWKPGRKGEEPDPASEVIPHPLLRRARAQFRRRPQNEAPPTDQ